MAKLAYASLGPDCGIKFRIEEHRHRGEHTQSGLFDCVQSDLLSVVAVLAADDHFFDASRWRHTGVTEAGYHTFSHECSIVSLHDAKLTSFPSIEAAQEAVSSKYRRRLERLRTLLNSQEGGMCFIHVVDGSNYENLRPPPTSETVADVLTLLQRSNPRHRLLILYDAEYCALDAMWVQGVQYLDLRACLCKGSDGVETKSDWKRSQYMWKLVFDRMALAVQATACFES